MKLPRAAVAAAGLLLAQQAQAASFVVLGGEPVVRPRSVLVLGEPAVPRRPATARTARAVPPPDRSIETAALRPSHPAMADAAADAAPAEPAQDAPASVEPDPRSMVAWPPVLSRSMVAFGVPLPDEPQVVAMAPRAPFSLPRRVPGGARRRGVPVRADARTRRRGGGAGGAKGGGAEGARVGGLAAGARGRRAQGDRAAEAAGQGAGAFSPALGAGDAAAGDAAGIGSGRGTSFDRPPGSTVARPMVDRKDRRDQPAIFEKSATWPRRAADARQQRQAVRPHRLVLGIDHHGPRRRRRWAP
jgi:hypothetical protein